MNKYEVGCIVSARVTGIKPYGIFVSFGDDCVGLIHISEVSSYYVNDITNYAKIGDYLEAKIVSIDDDCKYKLTIKYNEDDIKRRDRKKIVETPNGFNTLHKKIDIWVNEYLSKK